MELRPILRLLIAVMALAGAASTLAAPGPGDQGILSTSSDEHLWFIFEPAAPDEDVTVWHHTPDPSASFMEPLVKLAASPERLAAWGTSLWVVFAPKEDRPDAQREVFTVSVEFNPVLGGFHTRPLDRLEVVPRLPGSGQLAALTGTAEGPVALLMPADENMGDASTEADHDPGSPRLLRLAVDGWQSLDLPEGFEPGGEHLLAAAGPEGRLLYFLNLPPNASEADGWILHVRDPSGAWTSGPVSASALQIRSLVRLGSQVVAVLGSPDAPRYEVAYVRPGKLLSLGAFDRPEASWTAAGLRDGVRILSGTSLEDASVFRIDELGGVPGPVERLTRRPVDMMNTLRMPVLLSIAVFALVLVMFLGPAAQKAVKLAEQHEALPAAPRLMAVIVDLIPGGIITMAILGCRVPDLLGLPLMTITFDQSVPYIIMASITMLHCTVSELLWSKTLGKVVVGAVVCSAAGGKPRAGQILLRNLVKLLVLLVPLLAVVALLTPNLQGLDDLAGRTVVVRPRPASPDGGQKSDKP